MRKLVAFVVFKVELGNEVFREDFLTMSLIYCKMMDL